MVNIQSLIRELSQHYQTGDAVSEGGFTLYSLLGSGNTPIIGLREAEELGVGWVEELENESVEHLQAINKGEVPILIPYLAQIQGGRQDRTVFEPIIVPTGHDESNPLTIPARCIEQSRWRYASSTGDKTTRRHYSAKSRMGSQMARSVSETSGQDNVWMNIEVARGLIGLDGDVAPTSSYREMSEAIFEKEKELKELKERLMAATGHPDQVGVIVTYDGKILGLETYGSSQLWKTFRDEVISGFLIDRYFLKDKEDEKVLDSEDMLSTIEHEFKSTDVKEQDSSGTGKLYRFGDASWRGVTIIHEGVPVHLYAVKQQVDPVKGRSSPRRNLDFDPVWRTRRQEQRRVPDEEMEDIVPYTSR